MVKVERDENSWPDRVGDFRIVDAEGRHMMWVCHADFGDQTPVIAERVLAAMSDEALEAIPQIERVLVTKLRGRKLIGMRVPVGRACQIGDGSWRAVVGTLQVTIHPDDDGMVEVQAEPEAVER